MKKIIIDLDGTLTIDEAGVDYSKKSVNVAVRDRLKEMRRTGYAITVFTARNMQTFNGDVELIKINTLPVILEWLDRNDVPYDEVLIGKPWCGQRGFYVDDKSIRPDEFVSLSVSEIETVLGLDRDGGR